MTGCVYILRYNNWSECVWKIGTTKNKKLCYIKW